MTANRIERLFRQSAELIEAFITGLVPQDDFCRQLEALLQPLMVHGKLGMTGVLMTYSSFGERIRGLIHEELHALANKIFGVPFGSVGAIRETDRGRVWGFAFIDVRKARETPHLRRRLARAQKLHLLIDSLGI